MRKRKKPLALYTYYKPKYWKDIFEDWDIKFTPMSDFNDPFEGRASFKETYDDKFFLEYPEARIAGMTTQEINARMTPELRKELVDRILLKNSSRFGIFCLTTKPDNLLMWSHYAAAHTGFVVKFNLDSDFFTKEYADSSWKPKPIEYVGRRPLLETLTGGTRENGAGDFFYKKSRRWEYEKEYRMICSFVDKGYKCKTKIKNNKEIKGFHSIPKDAISEVIFGVKTSESLMSEICEAITSNNECAHIKFKKMSLHLTSYKLNISEISRKKILR